jgi:hypothetical protein
MGDTPPIPVIPRTSCIIFWSTRTSRSPKWSIQLRIPEQNFVDMSHYPLLIVRWGICKGTPSLETWATARLPPNALFNVFSPALPTWETVYSIRNPSTPPSQGTKAPT